MPESTKRLSPSTIGAGVPAGANIATHDAGVISPKLLTQLIAMPSLVGSLRAGGAGKTPVTEALARHYAGRGLRVGVLAYRLGPGRKDAPDADLQEVFPDSDWRLFS